jgi:hypothetical protein
LVVPTLVITEVVYLIGTRLGADAEVRFLGDLAAGDFVVEPVAASDWLRIAALVFRYRDLSLESGWGSARSQPSIDAIFRSFDLPTPLPSSFSPDVLVKGPPNEPLSVGVRLC